LGKNWPICFDWRGRGGEKRVLEKQKHRINGK